MSRLSELVELDLETALRDLLEQFEPTSPPTIAVHTSEGIDYFPVLEECEDAISNAEMVLSQIEDQEIDE